MFQDGDDGGDRWSRGSVSLIGAGLAHLGMIALQIVLLGGLVLWSATQSSNPPMGLYAAWVVCMVPPALLSVGVALLLLLAGRAQRDGGLTPIVLVAVVAGVFVPAFRMGIAALTCNVFELPLHLIPALATLLAAVLVATDRPTPPRDPMRAGSSAGGGSR